MKNLTSFLGVLFITSAAIAHHTTTKNTPERSFTTIAGVNENAQLDFSSPKPYGAIWKSSNHYFYVTCAEVDSNNNQCVKFQMVSIGDFRRNPNGQVSEKKEVTKSIGAFFKPDQDQESLKEKVSDLGLITAKRDFITGPLDFFVATYENSWVIYSLNAITSDIVDRLFDRTKFSQVFSYNPDDLNAGQSSAIHAIHRDLMYAAEHQER